MNIKIRKIEKIGTYFPSNDRESFSFLFSIGLSTFDGLEVVVVVVVVVGRDGGIFCCHNEYSEIDGSIKNVGFERFCLFCKEFDLISID